LEQNSVRIENLALHQEYIDEVAEWLYREFAANVPGRTLQTVTDKLKNRCHDNIPFSLIAISGNRCVGICSVFENDLKTMDMGPWLAGLYVDTDFRRKGIAQLLIDGILVSCGKMGVGRVFLRTESAKEYYRKRGWAFMKDTVDEYGEETSVFYMDI